MFYAAKHSYYLGHNDKTHRGTISQLNINFVKREIWKRWYGSIYQCLKLERGFDYSITKELPVRIRRILNGTYILFKCVRLLSQKRVEISWNLNNNFSNIKLLCLAKRLGIFKIKKPIQRCAPKTTALFWRIFLIASENIPKCDNSILFFWPCIEFSPGFLPIPGSFSHIAKCIRTYNPF